MTPDLPFKDIAACIEFAKFYKKLYNTSTASAQDIAIAVANDSNLKIPADFERQWRMQTRSRSRHRRDCGTGSGGFQPGNSCAGGGGGNVSSSGAPLNPSKQPGDWMNKKGYPSEVKTVFDAKAYAILIAQHRANGKSAQDSKRLAAADLVALTGSARDAFMTEFGLGRGDIDIEAKTLKNDPGIYAAEKAIASGKIRPAIVQEPPGQDGGIARPPVAPPPAPIDPPLQLSGPKGSAQ